VSVPRLVGAAGMIVGSGAARGLKRNAAIDKIRQGMAWRAERGERGGDFGTASLGLRSYITLARITVESESVRRPALVH
jgi:hypothetical protein